MSNDATLAPRLRADIERSGYYPELVSDTLDTALASEPVVAYVVHHEATFDRDELRRHVTVLALTPTRLIVGHTDEHPVDDELAQIQVGDAVLVLDGDEHHARGGARPLPHQHQPGRQSERHGPAAIGVPSQGRGTP